MWFQVEQGSCLVSYRSRYKVSVPPFLVKKKSRDDSLQEKPFPNSEVDSWSKEAVNPIRSKFTRAKEICNNKKKGATLKQLFEKCWSTWAFKIK